MLATGELRPRGAATTRANGFTLLELLVVLAVMALVAGLMFPRIDRMLDSARVASARSLTATAVRAARSEAVRTDSIVLIRASPDGRRLIGNERMITELPNSVRVTGMQGQPGFYADGSASAGLFRLEDGERRAELRILAPSGEVRWQP
jgi:general secretion pathway protein H